MLCTHVSPHYVVIMSPSNVDLLCTDRFPVVLHVEVSLLSSSAVLGLRRSGSWFLYAKNYTGVVYRDSDPELEIRHCRQCFETVGWVTDRMGIQSEKSRTGFP